MAKLLTVWPCNGADPFKFNADGPTFRVLADGWTSPDKPLRPCGEWTSRAAFETAANGWLVIGFPTREQRSNAPAWVPPHGQFAAAFLTPGEFAELSPPPSPAGVAVVTPPPEPRWHDLLGEPPLCVPHAAPKIDLREPVAERHLVRLDPNEVLETYPMPSAAPEGWPADAWCPLYWEDLKLERWRAGWVMVVKRVFDELSSFGFKTSTDYVQVSPGRAAELLRGEGYEVPAEIADARPAFGEPPSPEQLPPGTTVEGLVGPLLPITAADLLGRSTKTLERWRNGLTPASRPVPVAFNAEGQPWLIRSLLLGDDKIRVEEWEKEKREEGRRAAATPKNRTDHDNPRSE